MNLAGWIGVAAMLSGVAVTAVAALLQLPRALRVRRRWQSLRAVVSDVEAELVRSQSRSAAERAVRRRLLEPYRPLLRVARHPLTGALLASYRMRRRAAARN